MTGAWSRTGDAYFYGTDIGTTYWVDRIDDGLRIQLGVPDEGDDYLRTIGWESDTDVILWLDEPYGDPVDDRSLLVRCDATAGDCERVEGGPILGSRAEMQES